MKLVVPITKQESRAMLRYRDKRAASREGITGGWLKQESENSGVLRGKYQRGKENCKSAG